MYTNIHIGIYLFYLSIFLYLFMTVYLCIHAYTWKAKQMSQITVHVNLLFRSSSAS